MNRLVALAALTLLMSGCGSVTGLLNREIQENEITVGDESRDDGALRASVLGMSENRRGILIRDNKRGPDGEPTLFFCAEPPPDVAMSTRAGLSAGVAAAAKGEAKLVDEYSRVAMALTNRTSLLDIYRTAVFSLCQLHMNGAIDHSEAHTLFRDITLKVIERAPSSETPHAPVAVTLPTAMGEVTLAGSWSTPPAAAASTAQPAASTAPEVVPTSPAQNQ